MGTNTTDVPSPLDPPPTAPKAPMPMKMSQELDETFVEQMRDGGTEGLSIVQVHTPPPDGDGKRKNEEFIERMETVTADEETEVSTVSGIVQETPGILWQSRPPEDSLQVKDHHGPWFHDVIGARISKTVVTADEYETNNVAPTEMSSIKNESTQDSLPAAQIDLPGTKVSGASPGMDKAYNKSVLSAGGNGDITISQKKPLPKGARRSFLQTLMFTQFTWVDIIIATGCTVAILLVLINVGVFIQYCIQKKRRGRLFEPPPPVPHTYCLRMDSLQVKSPSKKNRFCRSLFKKFCHSSPSLRSAGSGLTSVSSLSVTSDVGTQYESMDAMLAAFISNDLIVELNDRDSTCTSVSDGFTFSRDYGSPHSIFDGTTEL